MPRRCTVSGPSGDCRGNNREELAWLSELCMQDLLLESYTYRLKKLSVEPTGVPGLHSAAASVCLWAGTKRPPAEGNKWAEVTQSLWLFAWHFETGSAKKLCLDHTKDKNVPPDIHFSMAQAPKCCCGWGSDRSVFHKAILLSTWLFM